MATLAVRWLLLAALLAVAIAPWPARAQASGPCAALRLQLKVQGARDGSLRVGKSSKIALKVKNVDKTPLAGLGVKLALPAGLCPNPKSMSAFPPLRPKRPAIIEEAPTGGRLNIYWDNVPLSGGKKRAFRAKAAVRNWNATAASVRVEALVYLSQADGSGIVCSVLAAPVEVRRRN